jgi:uncharacterized protein YjbJ (UPF0337 family)
MNNDIISGKWTEIKGKIREAYGDLTDNELEEAKGNREQVEGILQQKYGHTKDEAREKMDEIIKEV